MFLLATLMPPIILSSVRVTLALPDVSTNTLYFPPVKFRYDRVPFTKSATRSIAFLDVSTTGWLSNKSIVLAPLKGVMFASTTSPAVCQSAKLLSK